MIMMNDDDIMMKEYKMRWIRWNDEDEMDEYDMNG